MTSRHLCKRFTQAVLSLALLFWTGFLGYQVVLDPLQIFHKPWWRPTYFVRDLRLQAAGIINNYDFDSLILGTSMAQNFSPDEAGKRFGARFVNLSPSGSSLYERSLILAYALREKGLRNVIFTLDNVGKIGQHNQQYPVEHYSMLYNRNPFDDVLPYINTRYLYCWNPAHRKCRLPEKTRPDLQSLTEWASIKDHQVRFGGLEKWFAAKNSPQIINSFRRITSAARNIRAGKTWHMDGATMERKLAEFRLAFDQYLLQYIREYPGTRFYLFFPPYSRLDFAMKIQTSPDEFELYTRQIRYVVSRLDQQDNAKVFGFEHLPFLDDIANYKDTGHYHPRIDSLLLQWMSRGDHTLNKTNVEAYLAEITKLAREYDVVAIGARIERYLAGDQH